MTSLFLCGECYCLTPATHWFGHREYHVAVIRNHLLANGFNEVGAEQGARRAAEKIGFEVWQGQGL